MPQEIKAFKCSGCSKLVHSNGRHLAVARMSAIHVAAEGDNQYKKDNQIPQELIDAAFCNEECFSEFVLQNRFRA